MKIEKKITDTINTMISKDSTKDEIAIYLITKENFKPSEIDKIFKQMGLRFRRKSGSTWKDISLQVFKKNKSATREDMMIAIKDSVKDPEYYVKGYYDIFKSFANI